MASPLPHDSTQWLLELGCFIPCFPTASPRNVLQSFEDNIPLPHATLEPEQLGNTPMVY